MFNFFRNSKKENKSKLASITYYIDDNSNMKIDIQIEDYEEDSINALTTLLKALATDLFFVETVNFVKQGLVKDNREDILMRVLLPITPEVNEKFLSVSKISKSEKPCVKPSDLHK